MAYRGFAGVVCVASIFGLAAAVLGQTDDLSKERQEQEVAERFQLLLEKNPRRGTAFDRFYGYHVERGKIDAVIKTYRDREERDPQDGVAAMLLGLIESQRGNDAIAAAAFQQAEKSRPQDALPSYYLGQSLILIGRPDAAESALERAIARKPQRTDLIEVFQALGRLHQRAQRYDQALAVWARLEQMLPDDLRVRERVAALLAEEGQLKEALTRYQALEKLTTDPSRQVQLKIEAADLKVRLGNHREALNDFDALLERLNPESWLFREVRRRIEGIFLRADDRVGLVAYYEARIKKAPDDLDAMEQMARLLTAQGQTDDARNWLERAVKVAPSKRELRRALIERLVQEKKIAEALDQYRQLAETDHNRQETLRDWGNLLLDDDHLPEAERKAAAAKVWRRMIDAKPDDPVTVVTVADLFGHAGLVDDAIALYRQAIDISPENPQYREYLGEFLHNLKRPDEALAAWNSIAAGPRRNAKSLRRLAEVLRTFGNLAPATGAALEARQLEPDDLSLRIFCADVLRQAGRSADALAELDAAEQLAETDDERRQVTEQQIVNYRDLKILNSEASRLQKELDSGNTVSVVRLVKLARLYHAARLLTEANAAVRRAVALDKTSIVAWKEAARIFEDNGDLSSTAEAYRKLTSLDHRGKMESLREVARLEGRLGHTKEAVQAARESIAIAPANAENAEFLARLCFQVGQTEEGLAILRNSVRVNSGDSLSLLALAEALAQQLQTDESIEIFWRAFNKTTDIDSRLNVVTRLSELYLTRNQFDGLIARLQRERGEANQKKELANYLAKAYSQAGDYGSARAELEKILRDNPRDVTLLRQLVDLAELEDDHSNAARYQQLVNTLNPSLEGGQRAAQLHIQAGEIEQAEAIWQGLAVDSAGFRASLLAIDSLLGRNQNEVALGLTQKLRRSRPNDWELLFREGTALARLKRVADAEQRFQSLLALQLSDDLVGAAIPRSISLGRVSAALNAYRRRQSLVRTRVETRITRFVTVSLRKELGLPTSSSFSNPNRLAWSPEDFGQARIGALGWLYIFAVRADRGELYLRSLRDAAAQASASARKQFDIYYLEALRNDGPALFRAGFDLARKAAEDPNAQWFYLDSLWQRSGDQSLNRIVGTSSAGGKDSTPPLSDPELEQMQLAYRCLQRQRPEWLRSHLLLSIDRELLLAHRDADRKLLLRNAIDTIHDNNSLAAAIDLTSEHGDTTELLKLFDRAQDVPGLEKYLGLESSGLAFVLARAMNVRASLKDYSDIFQIFDHYLVSRRSQSPSTRRQRRQSSLQAIWMSSGPNIFNRIWLGATWRSVSIDFPTPSDDYEQPTILLLRNVFELCHRDGKIPQLVDHFQQIIKAGHEAERLDAHLTLAIIAFWRRDYQEAEHQMALALKFAPVTERLHMMQGELFEQEGKIAAAVKVLDAIEPSDQHVMQQRELTVLRLATREGNVPRAKLAAERLFGLRLPGDLQVVVADQMQQLGMLEQAEAVLARIQRSSGNSLATLVTLMNQYVRQNQADAAAQIAREILRKFPRLSIASTSNADRSYYRDPAIQTLVRTGKIKDLIARLQSQLRVTPNALPLLQNLLDYQVAVNARPESIALARRIVKLRPQDFKLRFEVALELAKLEPDLSLEYFSAAIKADPSLIQYNPSEVIAVFSNSNRFHLFTELLDTLNFYDFQAGYKDVLYLISVIPNTPEYQPYKIKLRRKLWQTFTDDRVALIRTMQLSDFCNDKTMYDSLRQTFFPNPLQPTSTPWAGIEDIAGYDEQGQLCSTLNWLIAASEQLHQNESLASQVDETIQARPNWLGGIAIRAILRARQGQTDKARVDLNQLLNERRYPPRIMSCRAIAREIVPIEPLRDLVIAFYEKAASDPDAQLSSVLGSEPFREMARAYHTFGRDREFRTFLWPKVLDISSPINTSALRVPYYLATSRLYSAVDLLRFGFPADAQRILSEFRARPAWLKTVDAAYLQANRFTNDTSSEPILLISNLVDYFYQRSLEALGPKETAKSLLTWMSEKHVDGEAVDLAIAIDRGELDHMTLRCLWLEMARSTPPEHRQEVQTRLEQIQAQAPRDLTVAIASALLAVAWDDPKTVLPRAKRVLELLPQANTIRTAVSPPDGDQGKHTKLGLWILARELHRQGGPPELVTPLESQALAAAEPRYLLAILREQLEEASQRKDQATIEKTWERMLEIVLKGDRVDTGERPLVNSVVQPEQFEQVVQLANLALQFQKSELALRAIKVSLQGGPPLVPIERSTRPNTPSSLRDASAVAEQTTQLVARRLFGLMPQLQAAGASSDEIELMLRAIVLPKARPGEIFLYTLPIEAEHHAQPRSVGALLVEWSRRSGKTEELKRELEARRGRPMSDVAADVVLIQLALAEGQTEHATALLGQLSKRLRDQERSVPSELACHAIIPALNSPELAANALSATDAAAKALAKSAGAEPLATLCVWAARREFAAGHREEGKRWLRRELEALERSLASDRAGTNNEGRQQILVRLIREYLRAGLAPDALELLGSIADLSPPRTRDVPLGDLLHASAQILASEPATLRYERLKAWTIPQAGFRGVRLLAGFAPGPQHDSPPASFSTPGTRGTRTADFSGDVFSTAGWLIATAREAGKLDDLAEGLRQAADLHDDNAEALLVLLEISRGQGANVEPRLRSRLTELSETISHTITQDRSNIAWADLLLTQACLATADLAPLGKSTARILEDHARASHDLTTLVHLEHGLASQPARNGGDAIQGDSTLWLPSSLTTARTRMTSVPAHWTKDQGTIHHRAGGENDLLLFAYPLTGTFEVSVEASADSGAMGHVGYGGLVFEPMPPGAPRNLPGFLRYLPDRPPSWPEGPGQIWSWGSYDRLEKVSSSLLEKGFNTYTLQVEPNRLRCLVNGRLFFEETHPSPTSPWLTLYAGAGRTPIFRNVSVRGQVDIPRKVTLTQRDRLDGWAARSYSETTPPRFDSSTTSNMTFDWSARDGEITGRRDEPRTSYSPMQSYLAYIRPLREGETFSYEFFYEPGLVMVHPTLGSLAFLLDPSGMTLHWLTEGTEDLWTGLSAGNAVEEPAIRRGPARLPLHSGQWNALTMTRVGKNVQVILNGETVAERLLEPENDHRIGFFHDRSQTAARIRNAVLTGPWPAQFDPAWFKDLTSTKTDASTSKP